MDYSKYNYEEEEDDEESKRNKIYTCYACNFDCQQIPTKFCTGKKCMTTTVETIDGFEYKRGCLTTDDQVLFTCKQSKYRTPHGQYASHCCNEDLCNNGPFPNLRSIFKTESTSSNDFTLPALLVGTLLFLGLLVALAWNGYKRYWNKKGKIAESSILPLKVPLKYPLGSYFGSSIDPEMSTFKGFQEQSMSSGSGAGYPQLTRRTLARHIEIMECIGKGRYGQVYKGKMNCDFVAVKMFYSHDEASWERETEIYSTVLIRHKCILGYVGSDLISRGSCTQMWLVTNYHPLGSLYDFLNSLDPKRGLSPNQALDIVRSSIAGICHLHTEIHGTEAKPAIAHRDIKTKNIIMKTPNHCLIADFGLAVTHHEGGSEPCNVPASTRVGTKRYMAPEVLDLSFSPRNFQAYCQADMYAFSLVMWEVARCTNNGIDAPQEYQPPFFDSVASDPSFEDMRQVVCTEKKRPDIPEHHKNIKILESFSSMMKQCWFENPAARLTSLRVKKTLNKLVASSDSQSSG